MGRRVKNLSFMAVNRREVGFCSPKLFPGRGEPAGADGDC